MSVSSETKSGPVHRRVPEGDDRERLVCNECGFINYENPKMVVGSVAVWGNQILLCKRAIEPRLGYWTLPAGYMELGEDPADGARREAWEEARARLTIKDLLAVYSIKHISQVQLIYRATLDTDEIAPGPESEDVALFNWSEIPWENLAFPTVHWALQHHKAALGKNQISPAGNMPSGV